MGTKIKIIIGAVLVVLAILVVFSMIGSSIPDARYNYTLEDSDGFYTTEGFHVEPSAGNKFVIMHLRIYNDYGSAIETNIITWGFVLHVGDYHYKSSLESYSYPGHALYEIPKGKNGTMTEVFEIPKDATVSEVSLKYLGYDKVAYDSSIVV